MVRTTELAEVEALLERVLPDPMGFAQRLMQQVVTQWAETAPAAAGTSADMPDDHEPTVTVMRDPSPDETRANVTVLLASALGACDCWGLESGCVVCHGEGSAGWTQPDRELFQEYVGPAVDRLEASSAPPACDDVTDRPDRDQEPRQPGEGEE